MTAHAKIQEPGQPVRVPRPGEAAALSKVSPGDILHLTLPNPPSVNVLFSDGQRGRIRSQEYRDWALEAGWRLRIQAPQKFKAQVLVLIGCERHSMAADIDNRVKALFDLLVDQEVIADDRHVTGFAIAWLPPSNGLCHVAIMDVQPLSIQFQPANSPAHGGWFIAPSTEEEPNGL